MAERFVGAGLAFPMQVDATGGIALVRNEREIEESRRASEEAELARQERERGLEGTQHALEGVRKLNRCRCQREQGRAHHEQHDPHRKEEPGLQPDRVDRHRPSAAALRSPW